LGVHERQMLVGIVCRLDEWKGVDVFIDAAARIAAVRPDVQFVVVGGAIIGQEAYARSLEAHAEGVGLAGRMHFTGWTYGPADMPEVHRALDIAVLASSEPEPFGLVVVEAMATGVPVVATAQGGPAEIVIEGVTGLLVPPRDPDAMAAAVLSLVDDPAAAARMGAAGRARACERYSAVQYLAGVRAVYDSVLGTPAQGKDRG
jgi:glycosyltransferase involved in cell wall biosynthesis